LFFKNNLGNKSFFIGIGESDGENRIQNAIELALKNTVTARDTLDNVTNILVQIDYGSDEISFEEKRYIKRTIFSLTNKNTVITIVLSKEITLDKAISIIIIAY
jgi:cell division GTPase FtsZ